MPGAIVSNNGYVKTDTYALFGNLDYAIAKSLTLNFGARYTHERKRVLFNLDGSASGGFGIGNLSDFRDSRLESNISPSLGLTYAIDTNQNLYTKRSRGFKSGGWNIEFLSANGAKNPSFDTETVDSYEAGAKGKLLDNRLRYDVAAYTSRFNNFQVFQFVDLGAGATSIELRNAAQVKSSGFEGNIAFQSTRQMDVGVSFSLAKTRFISFNNCSPVVNCSGNRLPYAPGFTASLTTNYEINLPNFGGKVRLYGEYSYHGKSFSDPVNDLVTQSVPSRELVNARLSYIPDNSPWTLSLWARNLFDRNTVTSRGRDFLGSLTERRMDPRTAGIEAKINF